MCEALGPQLPKESSPEAGVPPEGPQGPQNALGVYAHQVWGRKGRRGQQHLQEREQQGAGPWGTHGQAGGAVPSREQFRLRSLCHVMVARAGLSLGGSREEAGAWR